MRRSTRRGKGKRAMCSQDLLLRTQGRWWQATEWRNSMTRKKQVMKI